MCAPHSGLPDPPRGRRPRGGLFAVTLLAAGFLLAGPLAVGAAPAAAGVPAVDDATCTACHADPRPLPPASVRMQRCATCHGPSRAVPVTHIQTRAREAGGSIRPDPILAKDFATITRDMIRVPGGPFILGDDTRHPDEGPMQEWTVGPFYIDRYEVTNADYHRFVKALDRPPPAHWNGHAPPPKLADHPVTYVSWYDARDYCAWRGKRLPTEFEWEKAARGTEGLKFPWGDIFDPGIANTPQSKIGHTTPVGSFPKGASPYGALDMAGNVWEWTDSWYKPYPGNTRSNPNYGEMYRIVRGGSWFDCEFYRCGISAPTFNRGFFIPNTKNDTFGFRCAATAPAAAEAGRRTTP
jgi:formylglycine-generating enzyme required for sulfatase activity